MKCDECKYCVKRELGYSNWTVEGTSIDCLLNNNPDFPTDNFYGEEPALLFAENCGSFCEGECVDIDVELELELFENYSQDPEIKELLKKKDLL